MKLTRGVSKSKHPAPARPTASAAEYRRPLYSVGRLHVPDGAPPVVTGSDSYGLVRVVRGGVTQHHLNMVDVIRTVAERRVIDSGGQEHLIFDAAKVSEMLGSKVNWRDVRNDILDMLSTVVQLQLKDRTPSSSPGSWGAAFPLATFIGDANSPAARAPHQFPAKLKRLVLSAGYTKLIERHAAITLSRDVLVKVLALPNTISRAVARWCLSHSGDQYHELGRVMAAVGAIQPGDPIAGRASSRQARRYVQQLRKDAARLAEIGIEIDGLRLNYTRQKKGVFITAPACPETPEIRGVDANPPVVDANPPVVDANPPVSIKEIPLRNFPLREGRA